MKYYIQTNYSSEFGDIGKVWNLRNINVDEALRIIKERKLNEINEKTTKLIENELTHQRNFLIDILGEKDGEAMSKSLMVLFL